LVAGKCLAQVQEQAVSEDKYRDQIPARAQDRARVLAWGAVEQKIDHEEMS
jgi:hypothetical protein